MEDAGKRLTLNVLSDGALILGGHRVSQRDLLSRLSEAARLEDGKLEIRVRGDREVPYQFVEPVLTACARAGLWNVKFSVFRPEDVR